MGLADKTVWDWMQLLIVPIALAVIGFWFTARQEVRQQELEEQRAQDLALEAYFDQMSTLMLKDLGDPKVRVLLRAQTLTVLRRLDTNRKQEVVQFLLQAELLHREGGKGPIVVLDDADLNGVYLRDAILVNADLASASLANANLTDAELYSAQLGEANLSNADLAEADLGDAWLGGADLSDADLYDADLESSDLSGANLTNANLTDAFLPDAYLAEANLNGADLHNADLEDASLEDASLDDADLSSANLQGAYVTKDQLEAALSLEDATLPDGSTHD
jgi:uncharacterized protein YjbI with pentapeptide repeats